MPGAGSATTGDRVFALDIRALWRSLLNQSPAFLCAWLYVFFEYVRPQSIYPSIGFLPWAQISIFAALILSVLEGRLSFRSKWLWGLFSAFSVVVFASSFTAQYPDASFSNWNIWINWILMTIILGGGLRTRTEFLLLIGGFIVWNVKMSQFAVRSWASVGFAFRDWGVSGAPGWFENSGEFGIEMCVFFPIAGYLLVGLWPRLSTVKRAALAAVTVSAVIGMVGSSSRGAVLGGLAVGLWVLVRSRQRIKAGLLVAALASATWFMLPAENKERWSEAGSDRTSIKRITYWKDGVKIAGDFPVLGIGYKNWMPYYLAHYNPQGQVPHNYLVECAAELGYVGLAVFLGLTITFFSENARSRRLVGPQSAKPDRFLWYMSYGLDGAMIGYLTSGFFVTVLFYPYFWVNIALAMALARITADQSRSARQPRPVRSRSGIPAPKLG